MSSSDPDTIRREIDQTRGRLSEDVDVLAESVRPSSVAKRTANRATSRVARVKDSVMGTAHDVTETGSDQAQGAAEAVRAAPDLARRQTRGNPLAAGAIALAAGWLVGSLIPASEKERELATAAKEQAQPVLDEAKSLAQETAEHLKEPAQQAVESVKDTARQGAQHVKDDGTAAAQDVKDTASSSARGAQATSPTP